MICAICHKEFHGFSRSPVGAVWKKDGKAELLEFKPNAVCCDSCYSTYVIPGRKYRQILAEQLGEANRAAN